VSKRPWYSGAWPRVRLQILERDGYTCQIRGKGCTQIASQVDHVIPVRPDGSGGAWWEPSNLRASCAHCNRQRVVNAWTLQAKRTDSSGPAPGPSRDWFGERKP
jgi:5-methylcytosine-specific restriction endonuclease McrA